MHFQRLLLASILPLVLLAPACSSTPDVEPPPKELPKPSTEFPNAKIYPSTSAQDDGKNLTLYAALLGDGKFLTLGTSDRLVARIDDGPELVLAAQGQVYDPHWFVSTPSTPDARDVQIVLDRAGTADDAKVELKVPPTFDLDGAAPASLKAGVAFDVAVTPAPKKDDGIWWAILEGDCVATGATDIATITPTDRLSFTFATTAFAKDAKATSCNVTVKVQHVLTGKADAAFLQPSPIDALGLRERRFGATFAK
jgi:hypothetical protein